MYVKLTSVDQGTTEGGNSESGSIRSWIQCLAAQSHAAKIKILVVWFGANDACVESSSQHVPLPKFIANLKDMVSLIHSADPETRVILITPPPVNTHQRTADLSSRVTPLALDRTFEATRAYAEGVKEAAAASKVSVVDVWTALWTAAEEREEALSEYLSDGLHLRPEGYAVVYEALMKTIEQEHADLHYERIGYVFPVWTELATSGI
ncbi:GDSL Lipase/Acylhydrolase [Mycena belliarum]|uniref:GDSL Lipase/Acylhydrolase n=1 Tax=Mycena belliarum TaxID=1033014 RepID=A0AAD6XYZ7_9AGAR|nr:GDSL Lipase/Acylhydrolase [Mycena belliae]